MGTCEVCLKTNPKFSGPVTCGPCKEAIKNFERDEQKRREALAVKLNRRCRVCSELLPLERYFTHKDCQRIVDNLEATDAL
jgi:hypothetical protein